MHFKGDPNIPGMQIKITNDLNIPGMKEDSNDSARLGSEPIFKKQSSRSSADPRSAQEKLSRLRGEIQNLDRVLSDVKVFAAEYALDELVELNANSAAGRAAKSTDYRSASRPQDWGKDIAKGSFVYFVLCSQVNAIKIGYTTNLKARLSALQTGNPQRLKVLGWMDGGKAQESATHQAFSGYHTGIGEWFFFENELVDYVLAVVRNQPNFVDPEVWMKSKKGTHGFTQRLNSIDASILKRSDESLSTGVLAGDSTIDARLMLNSSR